MSTATMASNVAVPTAQLDVSVEGMSCASCVLRVERAIEAVEGIDSVAVNLATQRAHLVFGTGRVDTGAIAAAVRKAGYEPAESTIELGVGDMTCASCVGRVERALRAVPGVLDATVNLATMRASVRVLGGADVVPSLIRSVAAAGYAAEQVSDGADTSDRERQAREAELSDLRLAVTVAAVATAPLLVFEMGMHMSETLHHVLAGRIGEFNIKVLSFLLAGFVMAVPGLRFIRKGWPALLRGAPDMNSLVVLGTSAAFLYSSVATFAPDLLPEDTDYTYFEASAVIITLILTGRWFEARAKGSTSEAIRRLMSLRAKSARVLRDGAEINVGIETVVAGDVVIVRPGERIPVDGEVVEGCSYVDEAMITGEPNPARKQPGSTVTGGTINGTGAFRFTARKVGADTLLAQIVRTVEAAQGRC